MDRRGLLAHEGAAAARRAVDHGDRRAPRAPQAGPLHRPRGAGRVSAGDVFPDGRELGSTWDVPLLEEVGAALGRETRGEGELSRGDTPQQAEEDAIGKGSSCAGCARCDLDRPALQSAGAADFQPAKDPPNRVTAPFSEEEQQSPSPLMVWPSWGRRRV